MKLRVVAACLLATPAAAAEPCLNVRGPLDPVWQSAVRAAEAELAGACGRATLTLLPAHAQVRLEMVTPDGRRAEREVERPRDLAPTALGLTATIPEEVTDGPDFPANVEPPAVVEEPPAAAPPSQDHGVAAPPKTPEAIDRLASLGLTFGTRLGLPTGVLSTDVELRGDVRVNRWVVSLSGRASPSGSHLGGHDDREYDEMSVGVAGGRLFDIAGGQLALTGGPRLVTTTLEVDEIEKVTRARRDLVMQLAARYVTPFGGRLRPAISFETEAAPFQIARGGSAIPSMSTSLRFGVVGFGP